MATTVTSSTGTNTSATSQAAIKVQVGGCITEALKSALEAQLIIEFPDALGSSGTLDVLTSTAVNQLVTQLVASAEFATLLNTTLSSQTYIDQVVASTLASGTFTTALSAAIAAALADPANITTIGDALCADTAFQTCITSVVTTSAAFITAVETRFQVLVNALNLFECATESYTVQAGNVITIPVNGMTSNEYFLSYNPISFTATGGGTSMADSFLNVSTKTPTSIQIIFPSLLPGDSVLVNWLRTKCDI